MTEDLGLRDQLLAANLVTMINGTLAIDDVWTRALTRRRALSEVETHELAGLGDRIAESLDWLRQQEHIEFALHLAATPGIAPDWNDETWSALGPDTRSRLNAVLGPARFGEVARVAVEHLTKTVDEEIGRLSGESHLLRTGSHPPGDLTPQMQCSLYALGIVISAAMAWWPTVLALAIAFIDRGCTGYFSPDP